MLVFSGGLFKFDKDLKPYRYLRDFSLSHYTSTSEICKTKADGNPPAFCCYLFL